MTRPTVNFVFAVLLLLAIPCFAQTVKVNRISPLGLKAGETTTLTLDGSAMTGATNLWLTIPAEVRLLTNTTSRSQFSIRIPKDTTPQIAALRVHGPGGASALQTLLIDDLATAAKASTNKSLASAQLLVPPVAVEGNAEENRGNYFAFDLKKGQRISLEVYGVRLGSQIDSLIRILDSRGRERAYAEDDPFGSTDSRMSFTAKETGRFTVEVRDTAWAGGDKHFYRLRLGEFPLARAPFPLAGDAAKKLTATIAGDGMEETRSNVAMPDDTNITPVAALAAKSRRNGPSSVVAIPVSDLPTRLELEPNNTSSNATRIAWPSSVQGRFQSPADVDCFEFEAKAGDQLVFNGQTRSLGSGCDLALELIDAAGKRVGGNKTTAADEGLFTNMFTKAGTYRLKVEELNRFGGPGFSYQIDVERASPKIVVRIETDLVELAAGSTTTLKVFAKRADYTGPIRIELAQPVPGIQLTGSIPEKKDEGELKLTVDLSLAVGQFRVLRLKATSDDAAGLSGGVVTAASSSAAPTRKKPKPTATTTEIGWYDTVGVAVMSAPAKQ